MLRSAFIFLLLSFSPSLFAANSQAFTLTYAIKSVPTDSARGIINQKRLACSSNFNEIGLPKFTASFPASGFNPEVIVSNPIYQPLSAEELAALPANPTILSEPIWNAVNTTSRHQTTTLVTAMPLRKVGNSIEKLVSVSLSVAYSKPFSPSTESRSYTSSSVLASGTWVKMSISAEGVYKIDKTWLEKAGFNLSGINPKNIAIYGNPGGRIAIDTTEKYYDDLQENAIYVVGENDGTFDNGDYILFYASGPHKWKLNNGAYAHEFNIYSDSTYYFITVLNRQGKRLSSYSGPAAATRSTTAGDHLDFYEKDKKNPALSGQMWFDDELDGTNARTVDFTVPGLIQSERVKFRLNCGGKSSVISTVANYSFGSNYSNSVIFNAITATEYPAKMDLPVRFPTDSFFASGSTINFSINYNKNGDPGAIGYFDFVSIHARRSLFFDNGASIVQDYQSVGPGNTEYKIGNYTAGDMVWDITTPFDAQLISGNIAGGNFSFIADGSMLHRFVAIRGNNFSSPTAVKTIANQNLHGLADADFIIITHSDFMTEAQRLATHKRNFRNMTVHVVNVSDIYNEFSSGRQDVCAIRDFLKMFYDRQGSNLKLKNVLLFGDASYDYKSRLSNNTNFVPTFESYETVEPLNTYNCDSYFGLLDDGEGRFQLSDNPSLDVAIGRFPVKNSLQASQMVDKVIQYETGKTSSNWKSNVAIVADDDQWNTFITQSDGVWNIIQRNYPQAVADKIYLEFFQRVSTAGGSRYPSVNTAINNRIDNGALLVNWIGHGGVNGWADERILTPSDVLSWTNKDKLSIFVTATCEFSKFDDPAKVSAGEDVILNPNGGAIVSVTTVRPTYAGPNYDFSIAFYNTFFSVVNGKRPSIGETFINSINDRNVGYGSSINNRCLSILGDPSIIPPIPTNQSQLTSINGVNVTVRMDTLKALQKVSIEGKITDPTGNALTNFTGIAFPSVIDKARSIYATSGASTQVQNNVLYKGKCGVTNGAFKFEFVVPKDIAYNYGNGRIILYAVANDGNEAIGGVSNAIIGGTYSNFAPDKIGPNIKLYLNNSEFASGGSCGPNPIIYATLFDSSGINTVGNGIGHDMVAILDGKTDEPIVLNNFYESSLDNFMKGEVRYSLKNLSAGKHTLTLKVWDVYNNLGEATIEFNVTENGKATLANVFNYPNPFTTRTTFMFDHNLAGNEMDCRIQIFSASGKLVKTMQKRWTATGFHEKPFEWDATDDFGEKLARGVYFYRVEVKTTSGLTASANQKLVVL